MARKNKYLVFAEEVCRLLNEAHPHLKAHIWYPSDGNPVLGGGACIMTDPYHADSVRARDPGFLGHRFHVKRASTVLGHQYRWGRLVHRSTPGGPHPGYWQSVTATLVASPKDMADRIINECRRFTARAKIDAAHTAASVAAKDLSSKVKAHGGVSWEHCEVSGYYNKVQLTLRFEDFTHAARMLDFFMEGYVPKPQPQSETPTEVS